MVNVLSISICVIFSIIILLNDVSSFRLSSPLRSRQLQKKTITLCNYNNNINTNEKQIGLTLISLLTTTVPQISHAVDNQYGVFESKEIALFHPVYFLILYLVSMAAAYQGLQHRRSRELLTEIQILTRNNPQDPIISELKLKRDTILKESPKDKHVSLTSLILGSGTASALFGGLSTFFRQGTIYPDVHLFGGLSMVIIWALTASLAPYMAKGSDIARNLHIVLNVIGLLIFTSQIYSGLEVAINIYNNVEGY